MSLESSLFTFVTGDAAVAALIGARMYPGKLPQEPTLPALTYSRISSSQDYEMEGAEVGVRPARFDINCWDDGYEGMVALGAAVRARLSGYIGAVGAGTAQAILIDDEHDDYEADTERWRRIIDFVIWYE